MKLFTLFAAVATIAGGSLLAASPAAAQAAASTAKTMNYDCTKPGNKNKAACKTATTAAPAKPMNAAKPMAAATPVAMAAKPMNYDCSKPGNKNKAACKAAAPAVTSAAAMAPAKPIVAAPAAMAAAPMAAKTTTTHTAAVKPGTVAATLKNGKVVHYDCTKPGNKDKTACKA